MNTKPSGPSTVEALETAAELGRRITAEAVWYRGLCNWVGPHVDEQDDYGGGFGVTYCALGPDLYGGTSGIALFFAELWRATGEAEFRRTALGAIRQALAHIDHLPDGARDGLHTGLVGVALSAARVGLLLDEAEPLDKASRLTKELPRLGPGGFDLISGKAGAILGLLALSDLLSDAAFIEQARRMGDALLQNADAAETGYSWKASGEPQRHALCGLSHGAAGAGYALAELYSATGEASYRRGAARAFDYENSWYSSEARNWPDLREGFGLSADGPPSYPTLWCHGAPGIALSRLRAFELTGEERYRADAAVALETTAASIKSELGFGPRDFSLCHGLAGNADVLLVGAQILQAGREAHASLAVEVARAGMELFARPGKAWPCGLPSGETQNLFLGLAGISYFYLRVHDRKIASPLTVHSEALALAVHAHSAL